MSEDTTTPEPLDPDLTAATDDVEDFDGFWQSVGATGPRVRIMGEVVQLPASLPLAFEMEARRLARTTGSDAAVVRRLLELLGFPGETLERWVRDGMTIEQLQVLLAWAPARIEGRDVTLAQVREALREDGQGKA